MDYSKIISVTGMPGLYELVSSKNDGAIVRSLDDKNTSFVSSRIHQFSHLESIEVFTVNDNVNLADVFKAIGASSQQLPDGKENDKLKKYFEKVFPDLDFERVYASDMKKMVKWYEVLKKHNIEIKISEPVAEEVEETREEEKEEIVEETKKPSKKTALKKNTEEKKLEEKPKKTSKKKKEK